MEVSLSKGLLSLPRASSRPSTQAGRAQKYRPRRLCSVGGPGSLLHGNPTFRSLPCPPGRHGLLELTPVPLLRFPQPTSVPLTLGYPSTSSPCPSSQRGHPRVTSMKAPGARAAHPRQPSLQPRLDPGTERRPSACAPSRAGSPWGSWQAPAAEGLPPTLRAQDLRPWFGATCLSCVSVLSLNKEVLSASHKKKNLPVNQCFVPQLC